MKTSSLTTQQALQLKPELSFALALARYAQLQLGGMQYSALPQH